MEAYEKGPVASRRLTTVELAANGPIGYNCTLFSFYEFSELLIFWSMSLRWSKNLDASLSVLDSPTKLSASVTILPSPKSGASYDT